MADGIKINLNAIIEVELTPVGLAAYQAYKDECNNLLKEAGSTYAAPEISGSTWRGHLWEAITIFGDVIGFGMPVPFVDNEFTVVKKW